MASLLKSLAVLGLLSALLFNYTKGNARRVTLPSLHASPSPIYTPEFYPGGQDLALPHGTMRYWLFGPEDGKKVVLIHGIATGASIFDIAGRYLADNKHRVLVFDLWGRGYSDAPDTHFDDALFVTQVALLLQKVGWTKTDVVGVSLGGGVAASFTSYYPEMVNRLVLVAPAGLMDPSASPPILRIVGKPGVLPILTHPLFRSLALMGVQRFYQQTRQGENQEATAKYAQIALHQFKHHAGFLRSFLCSVADFPFSGLHRHFQAIGNRSEIPVLAIWGDADTTVPYANVHTMQKYVPQLELITYPGGGHDIIVSKGASVASDISKFLSQ
ncbi:Alpha/Beta hydrolase protein [Gongronella butleri]|nr:Alpha/Beta hydrolase protein [Gongronella butleri]